MNDRLNAWSRFEYRDPEVVLRELRAVERETAALDLDDKVRRLRTGDLKYVRGFRDAALFTHGLATATGRKVYFAPVEDQDYDFVTAWQVGDHRHFCPVQLKEVPPADLNASTSLEGVLRSLDRYSATDTVLAVLLNQAGTLALDRVAELRIRFSQVWLFWCASADHESWVIEGDVLATPARYSFCYPGSGAGAA